MDKKWTGGGIPFGYRYNKNDNTLEVDNKENKTLQEIFNLAAKGVGVSKISDILNSKNMTPRRSELWTGQTISYILDAKRLMFYRGVAPDGSTGNWEPLLNKSLFKKMPNRVRESGLKKKPSAYLLAGIDIAFCGYCGGRIKSSVTTKGGEIKRVYYLCAVRQSSGISVCDAELQKQEIINDLVLVDLNTKLSLNIEQYISELRKKESAKISSRVEYCCKDVVTILKTKDAEVKSYKYAVDAFNDTFKFVNDKEYYFSDTIEPFRSKANTFNQQRTLILRNIEKITIFNDRVEIKYKFPINHKLEFISILPIK